MHTKTAKIEKDDRLPIARNVNWYKFVLPCKARVCDDFEWPQAVIYRRGWLFSFPVKLIHSKWIIDVFCQTTWFPAALNDLVGHSSFQNLSGTYGICSLFAMKWLFFLALAVASQHYTGLCCVIVSKLHCAVYGCCCSNIIRLQATVVRVQQHVNQDKILVLEIACYSLFAYRRNNAINHASDSVLLYK